MEVRAALLDKDVAGEDMLTVRTLDAESLGFGITAVLCGTNTFFMSKQLNVDLKHFIAFLSFDVRLPYSAHEDFPDTALLNRGDAA